MAQAACDRLTAIYPYSAFVTEADGLMAPVGEGIVQSLARPGGNITGLATFVEPELLEAKRLEPSARAMLPGVSRVAYLASKEFKDLESPGGRSIRTAAQAWAWR